MILKKITYFIFLLNINSIFSLQITNSLPELVILHNSCLASSIPNMPSNVAYIQTDLQIKSGMTLDINEKGFGGSCPLNSTILENPKFKIITTDPHKHIANAIAYKLEPNAYIKKIDNGRYVISAKEDYVTPEQVAKAKEDATNNLWMAVSDRDKNGVSQALAQGAKLESTQAGMTPLMMAVANLDIPVTQELLKHGANVNFKVESGDSQGLFPLALAAMAQKNADLPSSLQIINLLGGYGARANFPQWGYQNMDLGKLAYENVKMLEEGGDPVLNLPLTIKEDILMALENLGARPELWEFDRCQDWRIY